MQAIDNEWSDHDKMIYEIALKRLECITQEELEDFFIDVQVDALMDLDKAEVEDLYEQYQLPITR